VVEHLSTICEALGLISNTARIFKKKKSTEQAEITGILEVWREKR
jgi:hypothetical protein